MRRNALINIKYAIFITVCLLCYVSYQKAKGREVLPANFLGNASLLQITALDVGQGDAFLIYGKHPAI